MEDELTYLSSSNRRRKNIRSDVSANEEMNGNIIEKKKCG